LNRMMSHRALRLCGMMFIMMLCGLSGCLFVWEEEEFYPPMSLSPKPEIEMSRNTVESKSGDMIAFIPNGWTILEKDLHPSSDVIAIAVDSTLTLSAVFSSIGTVPNVPKDNAEKVNELMRFAMDRHKQRSSNTVVQIGKGRLLSIGRRTFGMIEFAGADGMKIKAVVWQSKAGNHYECALVPLDLMGATIPDDSVKSRILRSITSMIMF
jgi:hypothetical protein